MILNKIIKNKDLAWDTNSITKNDLYFRFRIDQNDPILIKETINGFREEFLDNGNILLMIAILIFFTFLIE